jgi:O-antigen/teichoic acid export membrane protein
MILATDALDRAGLLLSRIGLQGVFVRNVSVTFATQGFALVLTVATAAIIARWLGPEGKGLMALALLVPGMLGLFLSGGISVSNVYFTGTKRLDIPTLSANSIGFGILATILGACVVGALALTGWLATILPGVPTWLILLAMLEFPLRMLIGFYGSILQGLQRIATVNIINLSDGAVTLALTIALVIALNMGLLGALLASLGAVIVNLVAMSIFLRRVGGVFKPRWDIAVMRSTLAFGLRGYVGNVLQFFNYRLDMLLVNVFLGPAGVGIYSVSVRLAEMLWYLPNAVSFVIFPKAAASKPEAMNKFTPRVFRITLGLTAFGALGLILVGKPIIVLIYSSTFASAYLPLLALLPGVVLLGGAKVLTNEIAGRGYPHYNSINAGLSLLITIALDLLLIPRYHVLGASLASSAAYTATFLTAVAFYLAVSRRTSRASVL